MCWPFVKLFCLSTSNTRNTTCLRLKRCDDFTNYLYALHVMDRIMTFIQQRRAMQGMSIVMTAYKCVLRRARPSHRGYLSACILKASNMHI